MNTLAVILVLSYTMPGRTPDIILQLEEPSLTMCEAEAHEFLIHGLPESVRVKGANGVYAGCKVPDNYTVAE